MKKPLRILILDNNREEKHFGSKDLVHWTLKCAPKGTEVMVRRSPGLDLPHDLHFHALLISGSITSCLEMNEEWVKPYDDFVIHHLKKGTPTLGVCYGHQTIARCLFKMEGQEPKLGKALNAELGWQKIKMIDKAPLFEGLSDEFFTYESHYEEVTELPPGTRRLAETERCAIQAFELIGKPVYGIQFHPEYNIEDAEASMANKLKKGERKDWILNAGKGSKLYNESVAQNIFGNFFKLAEEHHRGR